MTHRRSSLEAVQRCFWSTSIAVALGVGSLAAPPAAQPTPPAKPAEAPKPPAAKPASPFESVPRSDPAPPAPAAPPAAGAQQPAFEKPKPVTEAAPAPAAEVEDVVEAIEIRGSRRVPQDTLRAMIFTKKGDKFDTEALHRDFMTLWNTGRFDDITLEKEPGKSGWIVRFVVTERRVVRAIKYDGNKSITVSEILDRFKDRRVGLSVETQYDQAKIQRAAVVLKEYLSERGRQFATVTPEIRQIPPSSIEVTFKIQEGAKVKVGKLDIQGNNVYGDRAVVRAMKNLKPIGIPKSIFLEGIFPRTYDATKFDEDKDRIRNFYQERGYFTARVVDSRVELVTTPGGGRSLLFPFMRTRQGKRANVSLTVEEGRKYRLNAINFNGVKLFKTPETLMPPIFGMTTGDVFSTTKLTKGLKNLTKLYGEFGYIDAVPEPSFDPIPNSDKLDLTLSVDEGKQFFIRRIDFQGNTTTRDKVIRREILLDEGDTYNTRLWEMSVLRLNQLGYFEALKAEEAATVTRDTKNSTVDLLLKVKERGKNSVSLTGGVSGIAGRFLGFGYSTNNFLGLGETLSIDTQLGDRIQGVTFGYTEPYLFDRPIQSGFTIYTQRFNYDQAREISLYTGRNYIPLYNSLGRDNLMNYQTNGMGFTVFVSSPIKRSFARWSLTYGWDRQDIHALTNGTSTYLQYANFTSFEGPNSLSGIVTSRVIPAYTYNTVDHPITPSRGRSLYASVTFAGSFLGGNVNMIEPTVTATYFRAGLKKGHVIGMRGLARFVTGYGGLTAPPFYRTYMGGEQDVRGFEIWGIGPYVYIPSERSVPVVNSDGSARFEKVLVDGVLTQQPVTLNVPSYQINYPGGDTQGVANFEYRIPIFGPLTLALFFDAGVNRVSLPSQLRVKESRIESLYYNHPQATFDSKAYLIAASQKIRTSTGVELQVMMPVVNAPFRFYWAYNPTIFEGFLAPPVIADRSLFPNNATYNAALIYTGMPQPYWEKRTMFRFTVSRTF